MDADDRYAKVTRQVCRGLAGCPSCLVLYTWLDVELGERDWTRTVTQAARELGWQRRTVSTHAKHLKDKHGLVSLTQSGKASARISITHNPARNRRADEVHLVMPEPKKQIPQPPPHARDAHIDDDPTAGDACAQDAHRIRATRASGDDTHARVARMPRGVANQGRVIETRVTQESCGCGRLLLTATDQAAGACVFCRDSRPTIGAFQRRNGTRP